MRWPPDAARSTHPSAHCVAWPTDSTSDSSRHDPLLRLAPRAIAPASGATTSPSDAVERGNLWLLRQALAALFLLRGRPCSRGRHVYLSHDMRIGARHLRRSPAFAITSILTLGISIGATAAIFSVVEPVLLRPLPYPSPERLAFVWERNRDGTFDNVGFQTVRDLAGNAKSIEHWAAVGSWEPTLGDDTPERVMGDRVSWSYFRTLGVQPAIGRDFLAEEDAPGKNLEVILSHGLWQRRFGSDSSVVGKVISIGGTPMTIVGAMPATSTMS